MRAVIELHKSRKARAAFFLFFFNVGSAFSGEVAKAGADPIITDAAAGLSLGDLVVKAVRSHKALWEVWRGSHVSEILMPDTQTG